MEAMEYPSSDTEIDSALTKHDDLRAALQIQQDILKSSYAKLKETMPDKPDDAGDGNEIEEPDALTEQLKAELDKVSNLVNDCESKWKEIQQKLHQCKDYLAFRLKQSEVVDWLANADTLAVKVEALDNANSDLDAFLRKQTHFERSLQQQQKAFAMVKTVGETLVEEKNFKSSEVENSLIDVEHRLQNLQEESEKRVLQLQGLRKCKNATRRMNEMRSWMKEKLHVALDDSYLELTNVLSKLQRHTAFEAEIVANAERMVEIEKEANDCRDEAIPAAVRKDLLQMVDDLRAEWIHLNETTKLKRNRLEQANRAVEHINNVDEVVHWLKEADDVLRNDDLGKDVESVNALLKKHSNVETELYQKEAKLEELKEAAAKFEDENHFAHSLLTKKVQDAVQLLEKLQNQSVVLKDQLEDSLVYHKYVKDIHDALLWEKEKIALVSSSDFGKSLVEVQSMMKRHQLLEADIANHNNIVKALLSKGEQMVKSNHQQSSEIEELMQEMVVRRDQLRDSSSLRKLRLDDALQSQQFFIQCHEVMSWITEKNLLISQKIHIDNDFIQSLLKRIDSLETELTTHMKQVEELQENADTYVKRGHFESAKITSSMEEISTAFNQLMSKVQSQKQELLVKHKIYQFFRESEELEDWINAQLSIASSEDYGKDLDDVERLIHNFGVFMDNLTQHDDKITSFNTLANELISEVSDNDILTRTKEVRSLWDDLMELANARKEALAGAKKVHAFDKRIDDTLDWILEKEALLSTEVNCQDTETIQDLKQKQLSLKQDVKAINEQVISYAKSSFQ